uniref:Uncharacterized protein n=1 Tax=Daphnia galeata TaxID=27404 RepID=A0A8J2RZH0_9CRUS|nr:unnamed protein product [Daphnia galeata]
MLIVVKRFGDEISAEKFTGFDEKPSIRRRCFFSLGVVSFTAFIFNLSFSIILTSAKPYLDKMDPNKPVQIFLDCSSQPSHWRDSFSVH